MRRDLAFIWVLLIAACVGYFLGESLANEDKGFLNGAITIDKMNKDSQIEAMTFHFKDFPYDVSTVCSLLNVIGNIHFRNPDIKRDVTERNYGYDHYMTETIVMSDPYSWFIGEVNDYAGTIERSQYINNLVHDCDILKDVYNELAADKNTTGITFYPKTIDGRLCTILEYTQNDVPFYYYGRSNEYKPVNVVGLFMPLNETKDGCDKYLVLWSINQTADWLDSVKVTKRETKE